MWDADRRHTFNLRKTTTSVNSQALIDLEEIFKYVKPPAVPPLFKLVCEEILARIASRQLSILPSPLSVLFFNADIMSENMTRNAEIDDIIRMFHFAKKSITGKKRFFNRSVDLQPYRTSILITALFRYIEGCSEGIQLRLAIPEFAYLLTGPPPLKADTKLDMRAYTRSVDSFLLTAVKRSPVKRDIFCYLMNFISQIYQLMRDNYRSEPALCGMTRYILANRFGEEMIAILCTDCNTRIEVEGKDCTTSAFIKTHIKPPYYVHVFDMMLEYIPLSYWREALNDPRRSLAERDRIAVKLSDLQFMNKPGTHCCSEHLHITAVDGKPIERRKSRRSGESKGCEGQLAGNKMEREENWEENGNDDGEGSGIREADLRNRVERSEALIGADRQRIMGSQSIEGSNAPTAASRNPFQAETEQSTLSSHLPTKFKRLAKSGEVNHRAHLPYEMVMGGGKATEKSQKRKLRKRKRGSKRASKRKIRKRRSRSVKRRARSTATSKAKRKKKTKRKRGESARNDGIKMIRFKKKTRGKSRRRK